MCAKRSSQHWAEASIEKNMKTLTLLPEQSLGKAQQHI